MPTVSFLMSNYKTPPAYLRRALDSMLSQTFEDLEAIVINDGVKDGSYDVLLEYAAKDPRIKLIENERNLGLPASLNRGIEQCSGKYIARMDTDDICYPERLELQVKYMEGHPDVMYLGAGIDLFDRDEDAPEGRLVERMCPREEYRIRLLFANEPAMLHPTVMFRSDFLKKNALRYSEDPRFRYAEDYELWTRCADLGKADILELPLVKYRNASEENRITVKHSEDAMNCIREIQISLLQRLGISPEEYDQQIHYCLLCGSKPYDLRYKQWMDRILSQNKKYGIYDRKTMRALFHDQWYEIVKNGIEHKKTPKKKLRCFLTFYPDGYLRYLAELLKRR